MILSTTLIRELKYCSYDYINLLNSCGISISISAKGNPYDNALIEAFFRTLKAEYLLQNEIGQYCKRNIKDKSIKTKVFLIDKIKASFLTTSRPLPPVPIPI